MNPRTAPTTSYLFLRYAHNNIISSYVIYTIYRPHNNIYRIQRSRYIKNIYGIYARVKLLYMIYKMTIRPFTRLLKSLVKNDIRRNIIYYI